VRTGATLPFACGANISINPEPLPPCASATYVLPLASTAIVLGKTRPVCEPAMIVEGWTLPLEAALGSPARGGASAVHAAIALLNAEPPLPPRDPSKVGGFAH